MKEVRLSMDDFLELYDGQEVCYITDKFKSFDYYYKSSFKYASKEGFFDKETIEKIKNMKGIK